LPGEVSTLDEARAPAVACRLASRVQGAAQGFLRLRPVALGDASEKHVQSHRIGLANAPELPAARIEPKLICFCVIVDNAERVRLPRKLQPPLAFEKLAFRLTALGNVDEGDNDALDHVFDGSIGPHSQQIPPASLASHLALAGQKIG